MSRDPSFIRMTGLLNAVLTSGLPPGGEWRCLNVEELSEIRLEPGAWRTAENVFNPQTCLDEVEVLADPLPPRTAARPPGR